MNRLRQMSIFAHIVEQGSVSAAASKLMLSKSVLSHHLKSLEHELGLVLIKRTTRRQSLTSAGEAFYRKCKEINQIADAAWDQAIASQSEPTGKIRISAPTALMDILVSPIIAELMMQYPKLKPELISDDQHLNLVKENIDLAVRVGTSVDSNLKQKRIGSFRDVLCVKAGNRPINIESVPYIANNWQPKSIKHVFEFSNGNTHIFETTASCTTNSFNSCRTLIRSGAGIGIIPDFYLSEQQNDVVEALPDARLPCNPVYALTPFSQFAPPVLQTLISQLEQTLNRGLS